MREHIRELTAHIVSAYVSKNGVPRSDLAGVVSGVAEALAGLGAPAPATPEKPVPPVPVKKTITADFIVSLEDGKQYKSLKRHLGVRGLTPEAYREKWGLPRDYPMVAPEYSAARSALAKTMGLGRKSGKSGRATKGRKTK
jgi:predicted transcriptional regulator